ncbi:MAG: Sec-independent protein translocase protein TatB, partial [Gammaproteobacteria bacterium]
MFDIGFWELFLILILALLVVGPERLPKAARTAGYWFGKARRYVEGVKEEVASEFDVTELKRMVHNQEVQINELQSQLKETVSFDDKPQETPEPDYEILEEEPT